MIETRVKGRGEFCSRCLKDLPPQTPVMRNSPNSKRKYYCMDCYEKITR
jgi:hypothetical protein